MNPFLKFQLALSWQMRINTKNYATWLSVLGFYILFILVFPLTIAPIAELLQPVATGIIISGILFANILTLDKLFLTDIKAASIYDYLDLGIYNYIWAKLIAHWLFVFFPLLLITPILAIFLYFPLKNLHFLILVLTLVSFIFLGLGAFVAALTSGLNNANLLVAFILLPLSLPIILLASISLELKLSGLEYLPILAFLSAIFLIVFAIAPLGIRAGLKNSLNTN